MVAPNLQDEIRLSGLAPGGAGVISDLRSTGFVRRRLLDLGFCPGTAVEVLRRSPLGDPTCYRIRNTVLALRHREASDILVQPLGALIGESSAVRFA